MLKRSLSRNGQAISAEYALTFMLCLAVVGSMSIYVKRAFEARIKDTQKSIIIDASSSLGSVVYMEYEPYYVATNSISDSYKKDSVYLHQGVFDVGVDYKLGGAVNSVQFSPKQVNGT